MIREQLEALLPDLSDSEWQLLEDDGYVTDVEIEAAEIGHLVERIRRLRATYRAPRRSETARLADRAALEQRAATRAEAVGVLFAIDAAERRDVADFRREVLRGRLLKPHRVQAWIERHREPPTVLVTTPEDDRSRIVSKQVRTLTYAVPTSGDMQVVQVAVGSVLDRLRGISEGLVRAYGWQQAQASTFVLTEDVVPLLAAVRARVEHKSDPATTRIGLDIDPATTPREVAERYVAARKTILAGRSRRMSPKHLRLAIFAYARRGEPWDELRAEWNRQRPDDRYSDRATFQRDATQAIRRLREPPYK